MRRWTAGWLGRGGVDGATGRHGAVGGEIRRQSRVWERMGRLESCRRRRRGGEARSAGRQGRGGSELGQREVTVVAGRGL